MLLSALCLQVIFIYKYDFIYFLEIMCLFSVSEDIVVARVRSSVTLQVYIFFESYIIKFLHFYTRYRHYYAHLFLLICICTGNRCLRKHEENTHR